MSHKIFKSLEKGDDVCLVSLDATAAFDRVWHEGLIYKLKTKRISGKLIRWFESYLINRVQRVVVKGQASSWEPVSTGVPQGSILGPLLFLVYVDDIVNDINSNIFLFADDTSLLEPISDPNLSFQKLNEDLEQLNKWSKSWMVTFNPTKTAYIIFSKKLVRPIHPDLYLDNVKLNEQSKHKQLGVLFNNNMTFDDHIDQQCNKAMKRLTTLKRLQHKIPRQSRLQVYLSFIRPILEFGCELYDNSCKNVLNKLEKVQRDGLLTVTRAYKCTSHAALLKETNVQPLSTRRNIRKKLFMYKYSKNKLPEYLHKLIPSSVSSRSDYMLRNRENIETIRSNKNYLLKSFIPSSIKSWNELSIELRNAISYDTFKTKLRKLYGSSFNSLYTKGDTNGAINHSRIRMGLSGLNAHRKKVNFIQNGQCDYCGARMETPIHYFFECPAFAVQRTSLLQNLRAIDGLNVPTNENLSIKRHRDNFIQIILFGTMNEDTDSMLFNIVQKFISDSKRFM